MFEVKVDSSKALLKLDSFTKSVHDALDLYVTLEAGELLGRVQELAGGSVLKVITGKYLKSIKTSFRVTEKSITAKIYSKDPRAGLFEWGGTTPARDIYPNTAKAMAFLRGVGELFAAHVKRPVITYKPHPTIHAAFDEMKQEIESGLIRTVDDAASAL